MVRRIKYFLLLISLFTSVYSFFISFSNQSYSEYTMIWLLPFSYFLCMLILYKTIDDYNRSLTIDFFWILYFIRFVFIPFLSSYSGMYDTLSMYSASNSNIELSIYLMVYEMFVLTVFILVYIMTNKDITNTPYLKKFNAKKILGNKIFYCIFIAFSIGIFFLIGRNMNLFSFIFIKNDILGERIGDETSTKIIIIRQILTAGVFYSFILLIDYLKNKYKLHRNNVYFIFALILSLINISIITGERRSIQIYICFATVIVLLVSFRNKSKQIFYVVGSGGLFILILMSIYKFFNTFLYGSYLTAIQNSNFDIKVWSNYFSSYFGGIELTATAMDMKEVLTVNLINVPYDFLRSIFGLSFLFKGQLPLTSEIFNSFVYGVTRSNGQLITSLGYGYFYFGVLLSPLFSVINLFISFIIEKQIYRVKSIEMTYIWSYIFIRFATNIFQITPPLINMASTYLLTIGSVYFVGRMINGLNRKGKIL